MPDFSTQTEEFTPFSVISLDGTSHVAMSGKPAATVIRIKIAYTSQTGKPLRNMQLCLRGRLLDDNETLASLDISPYTVFVAVIRDPNDSQVTCL